MISHNTGYVKRSCWIFILHLLIFYHVIHILSFVRNSLFISGRYRQQLKGDVYLSGPMPSDVNLGVRRFISAFKSHVSFILGFALHQEQASCPEGSKHRIGGLRMAPGDVAHVPRPPSPAAEANSVAEHFRSRARLRRLLVRLRRPTPHRSLRSLRRRGFAHYVRLRHYRSSLLAKGK